MKDSLKPPNLAESVFAGIVDVGPDVVRLIQEVETSRIDQLLDPTPKEEALAEGGIPFNDYVRPEEKVRLDNGENVHCRFDYHAKKERASYLVDKALNFGLVLASVMRSTPGFHEDINVQEHMSGEIAKHRLAGTEIDTTDLPRDELYKLWILDYSIWNTDAGKHNLILNRESGTLHGFDYPNAFEDEKERKMLPVADFYGVDAPEEVIATAKAFLEDNLLQDGLLDELKGLIREYEAEACLARLRHVAQILVTKGKIDTPDELAEYLPT
jgi:hypothetical protein